MDIIIHVTTQENVFDYFSQKNSLNIHGEHKKNISTFYDKLILEQDVVLISFVYYTNNIFRFCCGKIYSRPISNTHPREMELKYQRLNAEIEMEIDNDLELAKYADTNMFGFYRLVDWKNEDKFYSKELMNKSNKIKLKLFSWEELLEDTEILHKDLIDIIFDEDNIMKMAEDYWPIGSLTNDQRYIKYINALKRIGFIAKNKPIEGSTVLDGDIGEVLMSYFTGKFIDTYIEDKYVYPRLLFKTSPKVSVFGNDGTLYVPSKNTVYFMESKFYKDLGDGIREAIDSLLEHNRESAISEVITGHLKNLKTGRDKEIIEIDETTKEKLVIFVICENKHTYDEVKKTIANSSKLSKFKITYDILVFVLPILNKSEFQKMFEDRSKRIR